jgi:hypothetical protein
MESRPKPMPSHKPDDIDKRYHDQIMALYSYGEAQIYPPETLHTLRTRAETFKTTPIGDDVAMIKLFQYCVRFYGRQVTGQHQIDQVTLTLNAPVPRRAPLSVEAINLRMKEQLRSFMPN